MTRFECATGFFVEINWNEKKVVWGYPGRNVGMLTWTLKREVDKVAKAMKDASEEQGLRLILRPEECWIMRSAAATLEDSVYSGVGGFDIHEKSKDNTGARG